TLQPPVHQLGRREIARRKDHEHAVARPLVDVKLPVDTDIVERAARARVRREHETVVDFDRDAVGHGSGMGVVKETLEARFKRAGSRPRPRAARAAGWARAAHARCRGGTRRSCGPTRTCRSARSSARTSASTYPA